MTQPQTTSGRTLRLGSLLIDTTPLRMSMAFRWLYAARTASLLVYGILSVGVAWQVYQMTASSLHVALVGACVGAGMLMGLLFGGRLADERDRRKLIVWSRSAYLLVVAVLWANAVVPAPSLWIIYMAVFGAGITGGISAPAMMAVVPAVVRRKQLPAAAALTAISAQIGAIIGPSVAGLLLAGPGLPYCFAIVAAGSALTPLFMLPLPPLPPQQKQQIARTPPAGRAGMGEAWQHVRGNPLTAGLLLVSVAAFLFAMPQALIPELGLSVDGGGARVVGMLYTAPAVGALAAALSSGWTSRNKRAGFWVVALVLVWGVFIMLAGLCMALVPALLMFAAFGACNTLSEIFRSALLQRHTPDHLRGRIFSLWLMQATAAPALGGVLLGAIAAEFSAAAALVFGGAACIAMVLLVSLLLPQLYKSA